MAPTIRLIVHNLPQAEAALRAAAESAVPVTLESPPGAGRYWGPPYFVAMIVAARAAAPTADCDAALDCGDAPGLAIEAFRVGIKVVRLSESGPATARVADIAAQQGARLEIGAPPSEALDLDRVRDPFVATRDFIASQMARS